MRKLVLISAVLLVAVPSIASAQVNPPAPQSPSSNDGIDGPGFVRVPATARGGTGGFVDVPAYGACRYVTVGNPNAGGEAIPLQTATNWLRWRAHMPAGDTQTVCCRQQSVTLCQGATGGTVTLTLSYMQAGQQQFPVATCSNPPYGNYTDTQTWTCGDNGVAAPNTDGQWSGGVNSFTCAPSSFTSGCSATCGAGTVTTYDSCGNVTGSESCTGGSGCAQQQTCTPDGSCSASCLDSCGNACTGGACAAQQEQTSCTPNGSCSGACNGGAGVDNCGNACTNKTACSCTSNGSCSGACGGGIGVDNCGNACVNNSACGRCTPSTVLGACSTNCSNAYGPGTQTITTTQSNCVVNTTTQSCTDNSGCHCVPDTTYGACAGTCGGNPGTETITQYNTNCRTTTTTTPCTTACCGGTGTSCGCQTYLAYSTLGGAPITICGTIGCDGTCVPSPYATFITQCGGICPCPGFC